MACRTPPGPTTSPSTPEGRRGHRPGHRSVRRRDEPRMVEHHGRQRLPAATRLMITAAGRGSTGCRRAFGPHRTDLPVRTRHRQRPHRHQGPRRDMTVLTGSGPLGRHERHPAWNDTRTPTRTLRAGVDRRALIRPWVAAARSIARVDARPDVRPARRPERCACDVQPSAHCHSACSPRGRAAPRGRPTSARACRHRPVRCPAVRPPG